MVDHYFSNHPGSEHREKRFSFYLRGRTFTFNTDTGVFSKDRIDYGSVVLIEEMEIGRKDHVLDVGCGYGPVGIVAAHLAPEGQVLMVDINERAVMLARENIQLNQIPNANVIVSNMYENIPEDSRFHLILTNPPIRAGKAVVHQILEQAYSFLHPGGTLWVVIQKKQGAPSALKKLEELFEKVIRVKQDKGYWILKATKLNE